MDSTLKIWAVILLVGALNYASRLSFIAFFARRAMPPLLARALRYVPAAMLTALIVPMVVEPAGFATDFATSRVAAAIATGVTAWFTRNTLLTLGVGMGTLWLLAWAAH